MSAEGRQLPPNDGSRALAGDGVRLFHQDELAPGEVRAVTVGGIAIVVIRKRDGEYRALRNRCAHQGALLSGGRVHPLILADSPGGYMESCTQDVLRCPWHGYEFDVDTGRSPADPARLRAATYRVTLEDGMVCIHRRGAR